MDTFDVLIRNKHCDMACVITFREKVLVSSLGFSPSNNEVDTLTALFDDPHSAQQHGFSIGGINYCVLTHLGDEIYAKQKERFEHGVVCLRTKNSLVLVHFNKTLHMSHCVVELGRIKRMILKEELKMEEMEEPVEMEKLQIFNNEELEDDGEEENEGENVEDLPKEKRYWKNIKMLLKTGFCDYASIISPEGEILSSSRRLNPGKDQLLTIARSFEDASNILESGFSASKEKYVALKCLPDEIYAKKRDDIDKGLVIMKASDGKLVFAHFDKVTSQGNLAVFVDKVRNSLNE